jgi:hypothetical protein
VLRCAAHRSDWIASRSSSEFKKLLFSNFEAIAKEKKFTGSFALEILRSTVEPHVVRLSLGRVVEAVLVAFSCRLALFHRIREDP